MKNIYVVIVLTVAWGAFVTNVPVRFIRGGRSRRCLENRYGETLYYIPGKSTIKSVPGAFLEMAG
jgi:hypothetical protein